MRIIAPSLGSNTRKDGMAATNPPDIVEVESNVVSCDGNGWQLGHPRVYLNLGDVGQVECPYCGRIFKLKAGAKASSGH